MNCFSGLSITRRNRHIRSLASVACQNENIILFVQYYKSRFPHWWTDSTSSRSWTICLRVRSHHFFSLSSQCICAWVLREKRTKFGLGEYINGTISYHENRSYTFIPSESVNDSIQITTMNIAYMVIDLSIDRFSFIECFV